MKQFIKYLLASTIGTVLGFMVILFISGIIIAALIGSVMMMARNGDEDVRVKENSVLVVDISKRIVERKQRTPFDNLEIEGLEGESTMELTDFKKAIEAAKTDENIKAIYLKGNAFRGHFTTMMEVRETLEDFKSSGKPVVAYEEIYTQSAYYIATVADELYIFKEGFLEMMGLSAELAFFKGTMEKLGIEATVIKGPDNAYKSAVEPFYREDMSPENEEQMNAIIQTFWGQMVTDISVARNIPAERINEIADDLLVRNCEDAVELGLFDKVAYFDEVEANLREKAGTKEDDDLETIDLADYARAEHKDKDEDEKNWELHDQVAVIYAVGGIGSGEGDEENIGSETLSEAIREARENEDVKAIVMRVNSPGGSSMASEVIWREAALAAEAKPFIVSFGDVAASGGYYISTHADRIFAEPGTITGSIGVFGIIPDVRGFLNDKLGMTFDNVKTNKHADFGSLTRGFDDAEMALLNHYVTEVYTEFVQKVAEGRDMSYEQVDSIARGRVWTGQDALKIGLVDEFGGMDDAIAYAAEQAGLEKYDILELPEQEDPFEAFIKDLKGDARATVAGWVFGDEAKWLEQVKEIEKMEGIQMRMLYDIRMN